MRIAEKIVEENFAHVVRCEMWLVGSVVKPGGKDHVSMNFKLRYDDDGTETVRKEIDPDKWEGIETPWDAVRYMLLYITQYFILTQFDAKKP